MSIEFPYLPEDSDLLGPVLRPVAPLEVKGPSERWFPALMYIDSGADISLVPRHFGELLGFDLREAMGALRGVSGERVALRLENAALRLKGQTIKSRIAIAFIDSVPYLLGRYDVFRLFRITFEEYRRRVTFLRVGRA